MRKIDVNKQVTLPLSKTVELVISGVQFRLFRAAVTVVIIALAVAFLMTMLGQSVIARSVASAVEVETAPRRLLGDWVNQLTNRKILTRLADNLTALAPGEPRWRELQGWGDLTDEQMSELAEMAAQQRKYRAFFEGLAEGDRRAMLDRARGAQAFETLRDAEAFEQFAKELKRAGLQFPDENTDSFKDFLQTWPTAQARLEAIIEAHWQAAQAVDSDVLKGVPAGEFLIEADASLPAKLGKYGFLMDDADVAPLRRQATLRRDAAIVAEMFSAPLVKRSIARRRNLTLLNDATVDMLFGELTSAKGAAWFAKELGEIRKRIGKELTDEVRASQTPNAEQKFLIASEGPVKGFRMPNERVVEVATAHQRDRNLQRVEKEVMQLIKQDDGAGDAAIAGFAPKTIALLAVSFVVCIVGIANAMLMSVTERFREIATMKCLGATDGFIMINFVLESCMQGVAGGVIGAVLGFLLAVGRSSISFGQMAVSEMPAGGLLAVAGLSFVLGVVISAMAAVYPAFVAARLAPMEAMRIE
ncbi:MAG: ABC transporter permease [Planctomycetota bacterium]|jgi:putative ABC transport system permease protein